jgi:predicted transcriptional regulator
MDEVEEKPKERKREKITTSGEVEQLKARVKELQNDKENLRKDKEKLEERLERADTERAYYFKVLQASKLLPTPGEEGSVRAEEGQEEQEKKRGFLSRLKEKWDNWE